MSLLRLLMFSIMSVMLISLHAVAGVPDSIAYQGRLTDAADAPVPDGSRDLILSIWTDSVGGSMLHSEIVVVTTAGGLFSTCIGCGSSSFAEVFTGQTLYLQTQLAGQAPMAPRIRLRSVPSAISASGVHGESVDGVARARGIITTKPSSGTSHGYVVLDADNDGDGHPEFVLTDSVSAARGITLIGHDFDDDGALDRRISEDCDDTDASIAIDEPGVHFSITTNPDSTVVVNERTELDGSKVIHRDLAARNILAGTTSVQGSAGSHHKLTTQVDSARVSTLHAADLDGDGAVESSVEQGADGTGASLKLRIDGLMGPRMSTNLSINEQTDESEISQGADSDGDGLDDVSFSSIITPTTAGVAIKSKGLPGGGGASRLTIGGDCDDTDASLHIDCDDDGDGVIESSVDQSSSLNNAALSVRAAKKRYNLLDAFPQSFRVVATANDSASHSTITQTSDIDEDGTAETSMTSTVERKSGSIIYLDRTGAEVLRSSLGVDSLSSSMSTIADLDDDGVAENSVTARSSSSRSSLAIKTKGTGAQRFSAGGDCDDTDASLWVDTDDDGDGVPESSVHSTSRTSGASLAINCKGTSAKRTTASTDCDDTDATFALGADVDGDGHDERWIIDAAGPTVSRRVIAADLDGDGLADRTISEDCDDTDASIAIDEPGVHVSMRHKGWDGTIKGNIRIDNSGQRTVNFDGDGRGFLSSSVMVGTTSDSLGPISHSSGAYLSAGGTWTNASDVNLKENFEEVDGAEILEKIEQLPISEWNYKNESDDVKHIGPTAQDFKDAFGVGASDKTISTIDPSGIALAAIKQLKKENNDLKAQVDELKKMVDELAKKR